MELLHLINSQGWNWAINDRLNTAIINAPSHIHAVNLLKTQLCAIAVTAQKLQGMVEIRWSGCHTPIKITAEMAADIMAFPNITETRKTMNSLTSIPTLNLSNTHPEFLDNSQVKSVVDIDINEIYLDPLPVYIFGHYDHTILFANLAACAAQGKTAGEMIGKDGASLDIPEELDKIINYIDCSPTAPSLLEYEFPGYRWYKDSETQIWRRKRMMFVENWHKIEFSGQPARIGKVLSAVDM